jgi:predicted N-acetyltransferase YhbS
MADPEYTTGTTILRAASPGDLAGINAVIEAAVMGWSLPQRVKRLSLPSYRYDELDLQHLHLEVATSREGDILGVAAWERADPRDTPASVAGMLLHGLFVSPSAQGQGTGRRLLDAAIAAARGGRCHGVLVKANPDATGFFQRCGFEPIFQSQADARYPYRLWRALKDA